MATKYWTGAAKAVAQVTRVTFSAYTSGVTYSITCNGKSVSFTATASTEDNVVDGLVAALQETTEPEFAEFTASNESAAGITLTGTSLGVPFTVTGSSNSTPTATVTHDIVATGPNFFDNAGNWSGGTAPVASDDLVFENSSVSCLYNIVNTTNYGDLTISSSYTGEIGLPSTNASGYREYRDRFLTLGDGGWDPTITIGQGQGGQSGRIQIDANDCTVTGRVYGSGSSPDGEYAIILKGTDASSVVDVFGGNVEFDDDGISALGTLRITPSGNITDTRVLCSDAVSAGNVTVGGGRLEIRKAATSVSATNNAEVYIQGTATCPTVSARSGARVFWNSSAGVTTSLTIYADGVFDASGSGSSKAIQACTLFAGASIVDPLGVLTYTTGFVTSGCSLLDVSVDTGVGRTYTPS